jgi:hypothetical protein
MASKRKNTVEKEDVPTKQVKTDINQKTDIADKPSINEPSKNIGSTFSFGLSASEQPTKVSSPKPFGNEQSNVIPPVPVWITNNPAIAPILSGFSFGNATNNKIIELESKIEFSSTTNANDTIIKIVSNNLADTTSVRVFNIPEHLSKFVMTYLDHNYNIITPSKNIKIETNSIIVYTNIINLKNRVHNITQGNTLDKKTIGNKLHEVSIKKQEMEQLLKSIKLDHDIITAIYMHY